MIFLVFLFNIILCTCLVLLYTQNPPLTDDLCKDNKIYYHKILRYLLYVYIILFAMVIVLFMLVTNLNISSYTNSLLIFFGFITLLFTVLVSVNIYPRKMKCVMNGLTNYLSLLPLLIISILSIFLGYLGRILEKNIT